MREKTSEVPSDPATSANIGASITRGHAFRSTTWLWLCRIRIHPYERHDGCSHLWWKIAVNLKSTRALGESGRAIGKTVLTEFPRLKA
jgi:hypothetical protein